MRDAEREVIGALMIDPEQFDNIPDLRAHHFTDPTYRRIFLVMQRMWLDGESIDLLSVRDAARDVPSAAICATVDGIPDIQNISHYAHMLIFGTRDLPIN
jgi:replicative DNA helicase